MPTTTRPATTSHQVTEKYVTVPPARDEAASVDMVCLVASIDPGNPDAEIAATEWLPLPRAKELSELDGGFIIIHPDLRSEDTCEDFL